MGIIDPPVVAIFRYGDSGRGAGSLSERGAGGHDAGGRERHVGR